MDIVKLGSKRTVNVSVFITVYGTLFSPTLCKNMVQVGDHVIKSKVPEPLIFPKSVFRYMLEDAVTPLNMKIAKKCTPYLAATMEYLCSEILSITSLALLREYRKRITTVDLKQAMMHDIDFSVLLDTCGLSMILTEEVGGGRKKQPPSIFHKKRLKQLTRNICISVENETVRMSSDVDSFILRFSENIVKDLIAKSNDLCKYYNKSKLTEKEIIFAYQYMYKSALLN